MSTLKDAKIGQTVKVVKLGGDGALLSVGEIIFETGQGGEG